jgi:triosephosphate isomerase
MMILDIGAGSAMDFRDVIVRAKTILWNGPMGVFEEDAFSAGTEAVGQAIVDSGAISVVGGGDSAAAAYKLGFADKVTHISTGGGATLEYLEGKELPGIAALREQKPRVNRRPLFAANWKMHKSPAQAGEYVRAFWAAAEALIPRADIALCAPFVDLETLRNELAPSRVKIGAQDCYWEPQGAFTGEISAAMLKDIGVSYCIVGHSERRRMFFETDEMVARKVSALLALDIVPIVCVGETLDEKERGLTGERVTSQVSAGLGHLSDEQRAALVIAYEPIWAIGTGLADDPSEAGTTINIIRKTAGGLTDARILYGGSMNAENVAAFCSEPNIDGGLVGSASLDPRAFVTLIKNGLTRSKLR